MATVTVKKLMDNFSLRLLSGDEEAIQRHMTLADINRPGLELAGYMIGSELKRLVVLGDKEIGYINSEMDEVLQRRSFEFLTGEETPAILITHNNECPEILLEIAQRKNFPVLVTKTPSSHAIINVVNYLDEKLAKSVIVHGELVRVFGTGVMITGKSGMGKSEIVLDLVRRGHQLVADDRVDCFRIHNQIVGKPASIIEGFMELRGVGIVDVAKMYGVTSITKQSKIDLIIHLERFTDALDYDRIGIEEKEYEDILGIDILKITIPVSDGRPMSTIIETAITNYLLLKDGIDSAKEFEQRILASIEKNKEDETDATVS